MSRVLIRRFRPSDAAAAKALARRAALTSVVPFFTAMAVRETTWQVALMLAAILFVVVGFPLQYCILSVPITLSLLFVGIFLGHWAKALGQKDMDDVLATYASDPKCGFWVAELVHGGGTEDTEVTVESEDDVAGGGGGKVVGIVGIRIKSDPDMREPPASVAWLTRMGVDPAFRRRGLGARLADVALAHCVRRGFRAVELLTTEGHGAARSLYTAKGFQIVHHQRKVYALGLAVVNLYRMRLASVTIKMGANA